jgi:hypothetical protein
MGKTIVNNNIKLKSGGGLINDATDGLSVDTGTTANKLVRLDANAKLPAVDGSQLTGLPTSLYQQSLPIVTKSYKQDTYNKVTFATTDVDGNLYVIAGETSPARYFTLYCFQLDAKTKQYKYAWQKDVDGGGSGKDGLYSCTVMGDYVYYFGYGNYLNRIDKATGLNPTEMSGASFYVYNKGITNDGTYLYVGEGQSSGYPLKKFSVSGTTISLQSTVNTTNSVSRISFFKDGHVYSSTHKINVSTGAATVWTPNAISIKNNSGAMTSVVTLFSGDIMITVSLNGTGDESSYHPTATVVSFSSQSSF